MQKGATIRRRQMEQETIWRGNQYARAVRLYYHKTGHYPQTLDDLKKGTPDLHFLRQPYKNPTNPADGSWRFIYVNAAGQIIGSTNYATLQQMALMDANGGVLPTMIGQPGQPGQPGVPASTLARWQFRREFAAAKQHARLNDIPPAPRQPATAATFHAERLHDEMAIRPGTGDSPNPSTDDRTSDPRHGQNSPTRKPAKSAKSAEPKRRRELPRREQYRATPQIIQRLAGLGQAGLAVDPATLAAMAMLKPTGPGGRPRSRRLPHGRWLYSRHHIAKVYHGGKKYINWEFIWNPLEDAAAAMQQQMGAANGATRRLTGPSHRRPSVSGPGQQTPINSGASPNGKARPPTKPDSFPKNPPSSNYKIGVTVAVEFVNRRCSRNILRSRGAGRRIKITARLQPHHPSLKPVFF